MKGICFAFFFLLACQLYARHGKGGSVTYEYLGDGSTAGTSRYKITVRHYIDCEGTQFIETAVPVGFFDAASNTLIKTITIRETNRTLIQKSNFGPCISPAPRVCFVIVTYISEVELVNNRSGYVVAEQECCRVAGIVNIRNSSTYGITNTNTIPGIINNVVYRNNSSPVFAQRDTAVICHNSYFALDFSAQDPDRDSLVYTFCPAKTGGSAQDRQPYPPPAPPYADLPFQAGFSADQPLGSQVTLNRVTGLMSGIAPSITGSYVIAVSAYEYRNKVLIGVSKKEVQITVADCNLTAAALKDSYTNCDSFTMNFENESASSNVTSYYWDFGVENSSTDFSTSPLPTYTYPDTGTYVLKLKVRSDAGCEDSAVSTVRVYPGFKPSFTVTGSCYQSPFQFTDNSYVKYGTITSRSWTFGDPNAPGNVAFDPSPTHLYSDPGNPVAILSITTSKGCSGSFSKAVAVTNKPDILMPFTDTLICSKDSLAIPVKSTGSSYSWSPNYNIVNGNSANPIVFPKDTTTYTVTVKDKSCVGTASVRVDVVDFITVSIGDTAICKTDTIILRPSSVGLAYTWIESPATNSLSDHAIKYPKASPLITTKYQVTANVGSCIATDSATVFVSPYPLVSAGNDQAICFGQAVVLTGTTNAVYHKWSPAGNVQAYSSLTTIATPPKTTNYVLTVSDTSYCRKAVTDTVMVKVILPLVVDAGNDTSAVLGQPLELSATYDSTYTYNWMPTTGIYNPDAYNPVITINSPSVDSIRYMVTATSPEGCKSSDYLTVKIFKTEPDIFVPSAFTPNNDGKNDLLKPVLVGIKRLNFFRVYNRWGAMVFSTSNSGKGWDGRVNDKMENTGAYVYSTEGIDYRGKTISRKGTVVLLR